MNALQLRVAGAVGLLAAGVLDGELPLSLRRLAAVMLVADRRWRTGCASGR